MIIRQHAVDVEVEGRALDLPSMVLNMDEIFEGYLRNVLKAKGSGSAQEIEILDGNTTGQKPLFDEPPSEKATPDIVCRDARGDWPLVIEVKNVPVNGSSSRGAIEQVVTYAATYRCSRVVLVHPRGLGQADSGLRLQGRIGELKVYQYVFDLKAASLAIEEQKFGEAMVGLIS
jgi:5-methylcytosine-specific restriction enzyme subunit McrC